MPRQQTASSHTALDPITHFVLGPILAINFATAIYLCVHARGHHLLAHLVAVAVAFALILLNTKTRIYSVRVQDRVIRLEERLRIGTLAPAADVNALSTRQFIALRFASDAELPALVNRTLSESLSPRQIKEAITTWRPDNIRI